MAYFKCNFFSNSLVRPVSFDVFIPNDPRKDLPNWENNLPKGKLKTLFLLHGYGCGFWNWLPEDLLVKYNVAVVIPNGENSFYLDGPATGDKFETFVGKELPEYVNKTFGLANGPEDTNIMGFSMGGFGALHTGLAFPKLFGKIGAMSSALIMHEVAGMKEGDSNPIANYEYYYNRFGNPAELIEGHNNPEALAVQLQMAGEPIPEIYMCCGSEDFLIEPNRATHKFFEDNKIPHQYHESKGVHDFVFWNEYSRKILDWMYSED